MNRILIALLLICGSQAAVAQIYRWVDEDGKVHYGDKIPAKYAKTETKKLNRQGITVETQNREKTAEELAEEKRLAEEAEAKRLSEAEQTRYDNFLLSTYPNEGSLERARDERIEIMDGQIALARKSRVEAEKTLEGMESRARSYKSKGEPVPQRLQDQLSNYKAQMAEAARRLGKLEADRAELAEQFEKDRQRLLVIRGGNP